MEKKLKSITLSDHLQQVWESYIEQRKIQQERLEQIISFVQSQQQPAFFHDPVNNVYIGPDVWNEKIVYSSAQYVQKAVEQMQTDGKRTPSPSTIKSHGHLHGYEKATTTTTKKKTTTTKKRTTRTTRARNINTIEEAEQFLIEQQKASLARAELIRKGELPPTSNPFE